MGKNKGHSLENAKAIADKLESADAAIMNKGLSPSEPAAKAEMEAALQQAGIDVFGNL